MQHTDETDFRTEVRRVGGDGAQRFRRRGPRRRHFEFLSKLADRLRRPWIANSPL
jgi:hypothetical protein